LPHQLKPRDACCTGQRGNCIICKNYLSKEIKQGSGQKTAKEWCSISTIRISTEDTKVSCSTATLLEIQNIAEYRLLSRKITPVPPALAQHPIISLLYSHNPFKPYQKLYTIPKSLLLWRYSRPTWTRSCAACCRWPCFGRGVGPDDPQRFLPTPNILWFCDSVKMPFLLHPQ